MYMCIYIYVYVYIYIYLHTYTHIICIPGTQLMFVLSAEAQWRRKPSPIISAPQGENLHCVTHLTSRPNTPSRSKFAA